MGDSSYRMCHIQGQERPHPRGQDVKKVQIPGRRDFSHQKCPKLGWVPTPGMLSFFSLEVGDPSVMEGKLIQRTL